MLQNIQDSLEEKFEGESEWFSSFFNDIKDLSTLREQDLKFFFIEILIKQSEELSKSILIGEYVFNKDFQNTLENIIKTVNLIYEKILFSESTILHSYTNNFVKILENTLLGYKKLFNQIKIHTTNPNTEIVFIDSREIHDENLKCFLFFGEDVSSSYNNVFSILGLSTFDHFFDESIEYFRSLINFENRLNSSQKASIYYGVITEKILFLKYKWGIRQITTFKVLENRANKSYIIDNDIISIRENPNFQSERKQLKEWKKYLENHYQYVENFILENEIVNNLVQNERPSMLEVHTLIKYFKDIKPNYENLKNIVEKFEKRKNEFLDDKHVFLKNLNYAFNNQFSLLVEKDGVKDDEVRSLKIKIDALQNETGYDNFFVDYKYLKYLIKKLDNLISNREALEVKNGIRELIISIRELMISCERKIEWSENHHNLLYQLPYKESLVTYDTENIEKVYYASSFLLPLSVEQIQKEFFELKLEFNNKYNYLEILSRLDKEFAVIKEIKEKEVKSIELISLFTAVISFIIGGVSGFRFIDSWMTALLFYLVFSMSLISFLIVLFTFTRGFDIIKKHLSYLTFFYTIFISLILILANLNYSDKVSESNSGEKKQDSLSTSVPSTKKTSGIDKSKEVAPKINIINK